MKYTVPTPDTPLTDKYGLANKLWYRFWSKLLDRSGGLLGLPTGHILIGNSVNEPEGRAVSGDITLDGDGVATLRDSEAVSVIGRAANTIGTPDDIAAAANDRVLARTADALAFQQLTVGMAPDALWTYAKIQNISVTQRILGRNTAGAGVTEEVTASQVLDWIGNTRGSVLYKGAAGWAALTPGISGHVLTSNGAGADPSYQAAGGGGGIAETLIDAKGDLIVGAADDTAARLAVGTDGHVLTADAASTNGVKWAAAGGGGSGGLVLLEQHTASASATLDFTSFISAAYDDYVFELLNLIPGTGSVDLHWRVSTDGGSNYDSGNNYVTSGILFNQGGTGGLGEAYSAPVAQFVLRKNAEIPVTAEMGICGEIKLKSPGSSSLYKRIQTRADYQVSTNLQQIITGGVYKSTTAINAVRFYFSSGNIASGTIRVYGLAKT